MVAGCPMSAFRHLLRIRRAIAAGCSKEAEFAALNSQIAQLTSRRDRLLADMKLGKQTANKIEVRKPVLGKNAGRAD